VNLRIAITADPEIPVPPRLYGGIERIISMLVGGLTEQGHEVTLFAHRDSSARCRLVPYPGSSSISMRDTIRHMLLLRNEARGGRFDLIHSFGRLAYLLPLLPLSVPKLMTYQRAISPRSIRLGRVLSRGTLAFTAISRTMLSGLRAGGDWHVVPNGVPGSRYRYQPTVAPSAPLVFLGRLERIKGPHLAIEVAKRTGRSLVLAGNIPEERQHREYFESQIAPHLDGERIRYVGPVDDAQKNELLGAAAALLMPVLWSEPFGIVMVEALACGTPVIGLRSGAVPEVVEDRATGFVCDSVEQMAAAVNHLGEIDRARCRGAMEQRFSDEVVVRAYLNVYRRLLHLP
jgi:glycosyltransferase involved in cell wall biosynthesis